MGMEDRWGGYWLRHRKGGLDVPVRSVLVVEEGRGFGIHRDG
jgi:hypothetical protein